MCLAMTSSYSSSFNQLINSEIDTSDENQSFYPTYMDCRQECKTYVTLQPAKPGSRCLASTSYGLNNKSPFLTSPDEVNLLSWKEKHPENWSQHEVLDWLYYVAEKTPSVECKSFRGENFQNVDGPTLCSMTPHDFQKLEPEYGMKLHSLFRRLLENANFTAPRDAYGSHFNFMNTDISTHHHALESSCDFAMQIDDEDTNSLLGGFLPYEKTACYTIDSLQYDFDLDKNTLDSLLNEGTTPCLSHSDDGYGTGSDVDSNSDYFPDVFDNGSDMSPHIKKTYPPQGVSHCGPYMRVCEPSNPSQQVMVTVQPDKVIKRVGRPRKNRDNAPVPANSIHSAAPKPKKGKGNHLWEFIRDTLQNPLYNPKLLKWENQTEGVFKFVQSEAVAAMWGRKKNNPGMTYEKLSRAMRFCRSAGYFTEVPKNGTYPKKLCFKFGAKATGWK